ncbi:MAG: class I SAM-dependent methyltransferase [Flavobacteriales bacterium]|nr:class I SAM-dependent methyltransferase [Flavobacteriales bacterium]
METIKNYYEELYKKHGYSPKSLGWDKGKQFLRFHQLTSEFNLNNSSVLDIGCGFGDFINYLNFNKINNFKYVGVDIVEEFVDKASKLYSNKNIKFYKSNFLDLELNEDFDFGIASGTFNVKIEGLNGYENIMNNLTKMFNHCSKAVSIDLLTNRVDYIHSHNFNSDPIKILEMAYSLSKSVVLKNNYFPFEFSITIFKDDSFRKDTTTYKYLEKELSWLDIKNHFKH